MCLDWIHLDPLVLRGGPVDFRKKTTGSRTWTCRATDVAPKVLAPDGRDHLAAGSGARPLDARVARATIAEAVGWGSERSFGGCRMCDACGCTVGPQVLGEVWVVRGDMFCFVFLMSSSSGMDLSRIGLPFSALGGWERLSRERSTVDLQPLRL